MSGSPASLAPKGAKEPAAAALSRCPRNVLDPEFTPDAPGHKRGPAP